MYAVLALFATIKFTGNLLVLICFQQNRASMWPRFAVNLKLMCVNNCFSGLVYMVQCGLGSILHVPKLFEYALVTLGITLFFHESLQVLFIFTQQVASFSHKRYQTNTGERNRNVNIVHGLMIIVAAPLAVLPFVIWDVDVLHELQLVSQQKVPATLAYVSIVLGIPAFVTVVLFVVLVIRQRRANQLTVPLAAVKSKDINNRIVIDETLHGAKTLVTPYCRNMQIATLGVYEAETATPVEVLVRDPMMPVIAKHSICFGHEIGNTTNKHRLTHLSKQTPISQIRDKIIPHSQRRTNDIQQDNMETPPPPSEYLNSAQIKQRQNKMLAIKNLGILLILNSTITVINLLVVLVDRVFTLPLATLLTVICLGLIHLNSTLKFLMLLWRYKIVREAFVNMLSRWRENILCKK